MKVDGFKEFSRVLEDLRNKTPQKMDNFVKLQAEDMKKDTKENTPVDTGTLKNAWQRTAIGKCKQIIFNATDYAVHVEYGHRIGVSKRKFVKGRFMLRKALEKRKVQFYRDLDKFVGGLVKK